MSVNGDILEQWKKKKKVYVLLTKLATGAAQEGDLLKTAVLWVSKSIRVGKESILNFMSFFY